MRTKKIMLVKMILAVVLVASAVLGLTPNRASKVSAASYKPKSSTTESTTESSTADNNINDLNVSMDSNGQIQTREGYGVYILFYKLHSFLIVALILVSLEDFCRFHRQRAIDKYREVWI